MHFSFVVKSFSYFTVLTVVFNLHLGNWHNKPQNVGVIQCNKNTHFENKILVALDC